MTWDVIFLSSRKMALGMNKVEEHPAGITEMLSIEGSFKYLVTRSEMFCVNNKGD